MNSLTNMQQHSPLPVDLFVNSQRNMHTPIVQSAMCEQWEPPPDTLPHDHLLHRPLQSALAKRASFAHTDLSFQTAQKCSKAAPHFICPYHSYCNSPKTARSCPGQASERGHELHAGLLLTTAATTCRTNAEGGPAREAPSPPARSTRPY